MKLDIEITVIHECIREFEVFRWITNWRASEVSETLLVVVQWKTRYVCTYIYIFIYIYIGT